MPKDRTLARIDEHLRKGELWQARDRATGLFACFPQDASVIDAIARVYQAMGDLPEAGRYWWLSVREDETARAARDLFVRRCKNHPKELAHHVPARSPVENYPPPVRDRIYELQNKLSLRGRAWQPKPVGTPSEPTETGMQRALKERFLLLGCFGFLGGIAVLGFYMAFHSLRAAFR